MRNFLIILLLLIFAAWCYISTNWYVCGIWEFCDDDQSTEQVEMQPEEVKTPSQSNLSFNWGANMPFTIDADMDKLKDSLRNIMRRNGNLNLNIVGRYFNGETNNTEFENLGIARATTVRDMIAGGLSLDRFIIGSKLGADGSISKDSGFFDAIEFFTEESEEIKDFAIDELDDKLIIYFPTASANPQLNERLNNRMKTLAENVESSGRSLTISGHTDNTGTPESKPEIWNGTCQSNC